MTEIQNDEVSIKELILKAKGIIALLYATRKWIIFWGLLFAITGFCRAWLIKPMYKAKSTFVLNEEGSSGGSLSAYAGIASQFGINIGGGASGGVFTDDNIIEFFKSRLMVEKTLLSLYDDSEKPGLLINTYISNHELKDKWKKDSVLSKLKYTTKPRAEYTIVEDSVLNEIQKKIKKENLFVNKIDKKVGIIEVSFDDINEKFAKQFSEKLIESVSEFYTETKVKKSQVIVNMLQKKTDSVRLELDKKLYIAATLKDENLNIVRAKGKIEQTKKEKEIEVLYMMYTELVKQLELNKISLLQATPVIQIIDTPILPLEKNKKSRLIFGIIGGFLGCLFSSLYFLINSYFKEIFR